VITSAITAPSSSTSAGTNIVGNESIVTANDTAEQQRAFSELMSGMSQSARVKICYP
jgi:hypothetical protein